jgi:hypothetical protein
LAQVRVPSFLTKLDKEKKIEQMKRYAIWKSDTIAELMVEHLESELTRLVLEDEKDSPLSWFQSRWSRAKRLGKREALRQLIKDLT